MSAKLLTRLVAAISIGVFLAACSALPKEISKPSSIKEREDARTTLTIKKMFELVANQDMDGVTEVANQLSELYADVPEAMFKNPSGIQAPKVLADGAIIQNALLGHAKEGKIPGFTLRFSRNQCYPSNKIVQIVYGDGSYLRGYERKTLWMDVGIYVDGREKCVSAVYLGRPDMNSPLLKGYFPILLDDGTSLGTMDEIFHILSGNDAGGIIKIRNYVASGYARRESIQKESGEPKDKHRISQLGDGYVIDYAHQYAPYGDVFAVEMVLSDQPCYPLVRAVQTTNAAKREFWPGVDEVSYDSRKAYNVTIFPHAYSSECVGWITAFYDGN